MLAPALALMAGACAAPSPKESSGSAQYALEQALALELPPLLGPEQVALAATNGLALGDRTTVTGESGSLTSIVAMGTPGAALNTDVSVGHLYSRGPVTLLDRTRVQGSVFTDSTVTLQGGAAIEGLVVEDFEFDPPMRSEWAVTIPDSGAGNVNLEPDQHQTLAPGRFGVVSVKSRSSITLTAGDYFFDALRVLEPQARIIVDQTAGPVRAYVLDELVFRGQLENIGDPSRSDLLLVHLGTAPIILEAPFSGYLVAPNATVQMRETPSPHNGAVFAAQIATNAGAAFQHRRFVFSDFFPPVLVVGPREIPPWEPGVGVDGDDLGADLGLPPGQEACDPGLELVSELDDIEASTRLAYREEPSAPSSCIVNFRVCDDDENPLDPAQPTEEELTRPPPLGSTCPGSAETHRCSVDPATVTWEDEFGLCQSDADCVLFGKVCVKVCRKAGCTGSADCIDPTCAETVEFRCAARSPTCDAQPTQGSCEEIRECAEEDASGSSDPREHELTGLPPSNIDDPPAETPEEKTFAPTRPATYGDYERICNVPSPAAIDADLEPEPEIRDLVAGNDKWGIIARPSIVFQADANPVPLGGQAAILARSEAGLQVDVRLWKKDYKVFAARGAAIFETCRADLTRELTLIGLDIDPGEGDDVSANAVDVCGGSLAAENGLLDAIEQRYFALRAAQFKAIAVKTFSECVGPLNPGNAARWSQFCESALEGLNGGGAGDAEGFTGFPTDCSVPERGPEMAAAWMDFYRHLRDRHVADLASLSNLRHGIFGSVPPSPLRFLDIDKSFTGFRFDFTYPVGPVTVSVDLELVGSWGISGELRYSAQDPPNAELRTSAALGPRFDASVIVFAGVGIGPVVVGVEGQLMLVNLQTPLQTGVALRQVAFPDTRPTFYPASAKYAFAEVPGAPAGYVPFGPTLYDWEADWTYGAGAYAEFLSGQIDLAAKIKLLFFTKKFKKKLAKWDSLFTLERAFTGHLSTSGSLTEILPENGASTFGTFFEDIPFVDPDFIETHTFEGGPGTTCPVPELGRCIIIG
ncbi:MAG: hypothetical protein DIU78_014360 [Pseudomonadota bacterium]